MWPGCKPVNPLCLVRLTALFCNMQHGPTAMHATATEQINGFRTPDAGALTTPAGTLLCLPCLFTPSQQRARMQLMVPPFPFPALHNPAACFRDCGGQGGRKERSPRTAHLSQHKPGRRHHDGPLKSSPQMEAAGYLCSMKTSKAYPLLPAPRLKPSGFSLHNASGWGRG